MILEYENLEENVQFRTYFSLLKMRTHFSKKICYLEKNGLFKNIL